jgi:hypothetical protein
VTDRRNGLTTGDTGTPAPPVPIDRMSEAEYRRLINHFLWLVIDEAEPLRQFGQQEMEYVGDRQIAWGPWSQADCAAVLLRWFDVGLLGLYSAAGAVLHHEARELLAASEPWTDLLSHPSEPYVAATKQGAERPDEDWYALVADLRDRS